MCFAGDGGGKGRRKKRRGVEGRAGEGAIPGGRGLSQGLGAAEAAEGREGVAGLDAGRGDRPW